MGVVDVEVRKPVPTMSSLSPDHTFFLARAHESAEHSWPSGQDSAHQTSAMLHMTACQLSQERSLPAERIKTTRTTLATITLRQCRVLILERQSRMDAAGPHSKTPTALEQNNPNACIERQVRSYAYAAEPLTQP